MYPNGARLLRRAEPDDRIAMTLTVKEPPELGTVGKVGSAGQSTDNKADNKSGESGRSNPVCLEVPVTVRSLPGPNGNSSDAAIPIREEGRTVIVFENGAVLRLPSNWASGHTVILSNAQGRDVVCRVANGKNLPTVKGYIEIEFVEPVNDFWRLRQFAEPPAPAVPPAPVPTPPAMALPQPIPVVAPPPAGVIPPAAALVLPAAPPEKAGKIAPGSAPSFEDIAGLVSMSPPPIVRPKIQSPPPHSAPLAGDPKNTQQETKPAKSVPEIRVPAAIAAEDAEKQVVLSARKMPSPPVPEPANAIDFMAKGMLASGQLAPPTVNAPRGRMPMILGGTALLLAGFGVGFFFMHRGAAPATVVPAAVIAQQSAPAASVASNGAAPVQTTTPAVAQTPAPSEPVQTAAAAVPPPVVPAPVENQAAKRPASNPAVKQPNPVPADRQTITDLKMSAPTKPGLNAANLSAGSAPGVTDVSSTAGLGGAPGASMLSPIVRKENQPAPPPSPAPSAPASRIVSEPKLISSVRPVYPSMARTSGIQGNVTVTADIATNGAVGNVKAISGPMFLRESAIEAVKEWKYSPELVDGKPVTATVTVSVAFRLN